MQRKSKTNSKTVVDFVTVAFAEDMELARQYKELLENNEIIARIKRQPNMAESGFSDIAILVSEESLDEAHALISERASYDDFFDMAFEGPEIDHLEYSDFEPEEEDDLY
ncbi:MAG: hypothetical protein OEV87_07045 [Phycisphaerae bacterium]|nr:hypothetical protein [Phycisphaerae bacterium]